MTEPENFWTRVVENYCDHALLPVHMCLHFDIACYLAAVFLCTVVFAIQPAQAEYTYGLALFLVQGSLSAVVFYI